MQMEEPPPIKENRYRRSYSQAFKAALVERCLSGEASIAVIAREHGKLTNRTSIFKKNTRHLLP